MRDYSEREKQLIEEVFLENKSAHIDTNSAFEFAKAVIENCINNETVEKQGSTKTMKASVLIEKLKELIDEHGDLEVGMQNSEYCMIDTINRLIVQKRNDTDGSMYNDPKELGDTYIVIDN